MSNSLSCLKDLGACDLLETYPASTLIVADKEIISFFKETCGTLVCQLCRPDELSRLISSEHELIIFFKKSFELGAVRQARAKFPEHRVKSFTYDVLPELYAGSNADTPHGEDIIPRVIIVSPASGYQGYLSLLRTSGVADFKEHFTQDIIRWALYQTDFSFRRYMVSSALTSKTHMFETILGVDVLYQLEVSGLLRITPLLKWFEDFLDERGTLYFTCRDKCE